MSLCRWFNYPALPLTDHGFMDAPSQAERYVGFVGPPRRRVAPSPSFRFLAAL